MTSTRQRTIIISWLLGVGAAPFIGTGLARPAFAAGAGDWAALSTTIFTQ